MRVLSAVDPAQMTIAIGGVLGALSAIYGTYRLSRHDRDTNASGSAAVLLGGWKDFQQETLKEVERVRSSLQAQIAEIKAEHQAERAEWERDSAAKQLEIDTLKQQIIVLIQNSTGGRG